MILQALHDYYERKARTPGSQLAEAGEQWREIAFLITIREDGSFVAIEDTREMAGRRLRAKAFLVPSERERSGTRAWERPNVLWDHAGFVLGLAKSESRTDIDLTGKQHGAFVAQVRRLAGGLKDVSALQSIDAFFEKRQVSLALADPIIGEIRKSKGANVTFRIAGATFPIPAEPGVRRALVTVMNGEGAAVDDEEPNAEEQGNAVGLCLVSGVKGVLARLHPRTPIPGSKSNAKLVSFQRGCGFDSYGRSQSLNAPVVAEAAERYAGALNHLLSKDSRQKVQVGDATVVFWAQRSSGAEAEEAFREWFEVPRDDPDRRTERVRALLEMRQGRPLTGDDEQKFFVLGLAPNAARIAVRFWQVGTIRELGARAFDHFEALKIDRGPRDEEFPTLPSLLRALAVQGKLENVPPNLAGDWMRAILAGTPYPLTLLQSALRRARAEQNLGYRRAAAIKACLHQVAKTKEEKPSVSLDEQNPNGAYRLGRFFAVLERIQEEANPGLNATIRDRYFGAASSTPRTVFPILNRLKNHHLAKLENRGRAVNLERLIAEIIEGLDSTDPFPASLSLVDQGRFAVGYYHQRQHSSTYKSGGSD